MPTHISHPALLGDFPTFPRTDHDAVCEAAWWHNCPECARQDSAYLDVIRAWCESAYDLTTTGILNLKAEVSVWSDTQRRFVWVERKPKQGWHRDPNRLTVTGYRFCDLTGKASFYDITYAHGTCVWSRQNAHDAGYSFIVPPTDLTSLPIRHGERNAKGYPSLRYLSCEFTPFADLPEGTFTPFRRFGTSRDWSRAYND